MKSLVLPITMFSLYLQECAANEERQLLEKIAELLASSNDRKKQLVCLNIKLICESHFTKYIRTPL